MSDFKEQNRIFFDYDQFHQDTGLLADSIADKSPDGAVLVAVARGGWLATRLVSASLEEKGIDVACFSVGASYVDEGCPDEFVEITQGLDHRAKSKLTHAALKRCQLWTVDSVCNTGSAMLAVRNYLQEELLGVGVKTAAVHWSSFESNPDAPWRVPVLSPDAYGRKITTKHKPYVEYPWEYASLGQYRQCIMDYENPEQ